MICDDILEDKAASYWLKNALRSALERDPVDAVADAEILAAALKAHLEKILNLDIKEGNPEKCFI
jgi:hypothetical protein